MNRYHFAFLSLLISFTCLGMQKQLFFELTLDQKKTLIKKHLPKLSINNIIKTDQFIRMKNWDRFEKNYYLKNTIMYHKENDFRHRIVTALLIGSSFYTLEYDPALVTVLSKATTFDDIGLTKLIVAAGISKEFFKDILCHVKSVEMAKFLVKHGAVFDKNWENLRGENLVDLACSCVDIAPAVLKYYLDNDLKWSLENPFIIEKFDPIFAKSFFKKLEILKKRQFNTRELKTYLYNKFYRLRKDYYLCSKHKIAILCLLAAQDQKFSADKYIKRLEAIPKK